MAWARRVDSVSKDCIKEARRWGAEWLDTSRAPGIDGLLLWRDKVYLIEWKTPQNKTGRVKWTATQDRLLARGWPLFGLTSPADVRALLGVRG